MAYGEGQLFSAGRGSTRLEIFPQTRVTRLTAPDVRVELFGTTIASVSPGGVEFHREHPGEQTSLALVPGGGVVFTFVAGGERTPPPPTRSEEGPGHPVPAAAQHPESNPETAPEPEEDSADHPLAPVVQLPARPTPPAGSAPTQLHPDRPPGVDAEPERLQLTGRVGRDPGFRAAKTGTLVGKFPLAVHREDRQTSWHTVLAFGERAEQLQRRVQAGELRKGAEVDVVGYLHRNQRAGKDGRMRTVEEIYAVAVKTR